VHCETLVASIWGFAEQMLATRVPDHSAQWLVIVPFRRFHAAGTVTSRCSPTSRDGGPGWVARPPGLSQ